MIGLGWSEVVRRFATDRPIRWLGVLRTLVAHGGRVMDTWPRNTDDDAAFGRVVGHRHAPPSCSSRRRSMSRRGNQDGAVSAERSGSTDAKH